VSTGGRTSETEESRTVPYNYGTGDMKSDAPRPLMFTGDPKKISWCKIKMYSHIIGVNDELWDIIEDGIDISVNEEGVAD